MSSSFWFKTHTLTSSLYHVPWCVPWGMGRISCVSAIDPQGKRIVCSPVDNEFKNTPSLLLLSHMWRKRGVRSIEPCVHISVSPQYGI